MGDGRYVTTISNDPPPPGLWCRVTKFTPAALTTPSLTEADEARIIIGDLTALLLRCLKVVPKDHRYYAQVLGYLRRKKLSSPLRALHTKEDTNG